MRDRVLATEPHAARYAGARGPALSPTTPPRVGPATCIACEKHQSHTIPCLMQLLRLCLCSWPVGQKYGQGISETCNVPSCRRVDPASREVEYKG